jgi:ABC-type phosphate/phosphonate transport system ATPase subunit
VTAIIRTEKQLEEKRQKALEAQRREIEAREKQRRFAERLTFIRKVVDDLRERSSSIDVFLRLFKDDVQKALAKARRDGRNEAAWERHYAAHVLPLSHVLTCFERSTSALAKGHRWPREQEWI